MPAGTKLKLGDDPGENSPVLTSEDSIDEPHPYDAFGQLRQIQVISATYVSSLNGIGRGDWST
jgi:hypothetical protein